MFSQFFHLPFQQYSLQEISTVYPEYSKSMQAYLWVYQRGLSPHFRSHGTVPRIDSHLPWSLRACIATHHLDSLKRYALQSEREDVWHWSYPVMHSHPSIVPATPLHSFLVYEVYMKLPQRIATLCPLSTPVPAQSSWSWWEQWDVLASPRAVLQGPLSILHGNEW